MSNIALPYTQIIDPAAFKSVLNAKIYIGEYGVLPNPANSATWKQAYFVQDDGSRVAASQPIRTNAAGFAVDGSGNIRTVQVDGQYSILVQDSLSVQKYSNTRVADFSDGIATYAKLRAFTGVKDFVYVGGRTNYFDGANGFFAVDASDTTSADNDGTILVDVSGRRWKRGYSNSVNPKWFGAKKDTESTAAINAAKAVGPVLIDDIFRVSDTISLTAGQELIFDADGELKQTTAEKTTLTLAYGSKATNVLINTTLVNMNVTPVTEILPWNDPTLMHDAPVLTGKIIGNFPVLQGIGIRLSASTVSGGTYSIIQFAKIDLEVYGLRDACVITAALGDLTDIVYVNKNDIRISSLNCLRPFQATNNAALAQIQSGNCNIADNDLEVHGQHYTGAEDFFVGDGINANRIATHPSDWPGTNFHINLSSKSFSNVIDQLDYVGANAAKIQDAGGNNTIAARKVNAATALFNGTTGTLVYADGGANVVKNATGNYTFSFPAFTNANSYVVFAQGSTNSVSTVYPIILSPTASRANNSIVYSCYRADTGAAVDIDGINFSVCGR